MSGSNGRDIEVFLRGGLGNQLFQYASGLAISRSYSKRLVLREDLLPAKEDSVGGISRWPNQINLFSHSAQIRYRKHQPPFSTNAFGKTMAIQRALGDLAPSMVGRFGFHSAERRSLPGDISVFAKTRAINAYMSHLNLVLAVKNQLAIEIRQIVNPSSNFRELAHEAILKKPVIVHVRLGDYVGLGSVFGELEDVFFAKALRHSTSAPRWLFTQKESDLSDAVLSVIQPERIIDGDLLHSSIENLVLMSLGSNLVASNSTLSWWAAILSSRETRVVAPYFQGKINNFSPSLTLPNWILINANR